MNPSKRLILILLPFLAGSLPASEIIPVVSGGGYQQTALSNSDTAIPVPFARPAHCAGTVASVSVDRIYLQTASALTPSGLFFDGAGGSDVPYYILIKGGDRIGFWYDILDNGEDYVVVDWAGDSVGTHLDDQPFTIRPHWTLGSLLKNGNGYVPTTDIFDLKSLVYFPDTQLTGINRPFSSSFFYADVDGTPEGWYSTSFEGPLNNTILYPDSYIVIRNPADVTTQLQHGGEVRQTPISIPLAVPATTSGHDFYLGTPFACSVLIGQSGLISSGAFEPTTDIFDLQDLLYVYDNSLQLINKPYPEALFYYEDPDGTISGWYTASFVGPLDETFSIHPWNSLMIRKPALTHEWVVWTP